MTIGHHLALQELTYLSQQDNAVVADIADTVIAVYSQWQSGGLDLEDYRSILTRNVGELSRLPHSRERDLAQEALEDLL